MGLEDLLTKPIHFSTEPLLHDDIVERLYNHLSAYGNFDFIRTYERYVFYEEETRYIKGKEKVIYRQCQGEVDLYCIKGKEIFAFEIKGKRIKEEKSRAQLKRFERYCAKTYGIEKIEKYYLTSGMEKPLLIE